MGFKQHKLSYDKTKQILKKPPPQIKIYPQVSDISLYEILPSFALNTVKTPSHFCVLVGTVFALGNQIWLHTFGLTQGDDRWDLLALHSPLFTLENFCYLWSGGRDGCFQ